MPSATCRGVTNPCVGCSIAFVLILLDRLWLVGDLVNRGPDSLKVLRFCRDLGDSCIAVLGNHDLHLLYRAAGGRPGKLETLSELLDAPDCSELIDWLRFRPLLHHDAQLGWCMVHAGLSPHWSLAEAKKRASAIERRLQGKRWGEFAHLLRRTPAPMFDNDKRDESLLFAASVFTRSRYATAEGGFDWDTRAGGPTDARFQPWFTLPNARWRDEARILYGHWAAMGLVGGRNDVLGLDSGCVWGGALTMVRLDEPALPLWQEPCPACQSVGEE